MDFEAGLMPGRTKKSNDPDLPDRAVEIKEALWIVAISCVGLLLLGLLHQSSDVMGVYTESGKIEIPPSFWLLATVYLAASLSVFPLLKDSQPADFRITAYVLTGAAPIVLLLLVVANLLALGTS